MKSKAQKQAEAIARALQHAPRWALATHTSICQGALQHRNALSHLKHKLGIPGNIPDHDEPLLALLNANNPTTPYQGRH